MKNVNLILVRFMSPLDFAPSTVLRVKYLWHSFFCTFVSFSLLILDLFHQNPWCQDPRPSTGPQSAALWAVLFQLNYVLLFLTGLVQSRFARENCLLLLVCSHPDSILMVEDSENSWTVFLARRGPYLQSGSTSVRVTVFILVPW